MKTQSIIKMALTLTQFLSSSIIGIKKHYLNAPEEVLSWLKVDRIYKFGHFLPSIVLCVILAIKLLPLMSTGYANALEDNGAIIPITFFSFLIPILVLNGIIIEKILMMTNEDYKKYIKGDS